MKFFYHRQDTTCSYPKNDPLLLPHNPLHHLSADLPQSQGQIVPLRHLALLAPVAIVEVATRNAVQFRRHCAKHAGGRRLLQALGERPDQIEDQPVKPPVSGDVRIDHVAGMDAEDGHAASLQFFGQLPGEKDVAQFRVVVGHHGPVFGCCVR